MPVSIERDLNGGVPHLFLDIFWTFALGNQQGSARMPQVVEPDASKACLLERRLEYPVHDMRGVEMASLGCSKD